MVALNEALTVLEHVGSGQSTVDIIEAPDAEKQIRSALHYTETERGELIKCTLKAIARLMSEYGGKSVWPILSSMRQACLDCQQATMRPSLLWTQ